MLLPLPGASPILKTALQTVKPVTTTISAARTLALPTFFKTLTSTVQQILPTVLEYKLATKMIKAQSQASAQELAPIIAPYLPQQQAVERIQEKREERLEPVREVQAMLFPQYLMYGALIGIGVYLLARSRKK